jgi:SAM-dependent methyltransferase
MVSGADPDGTGSPPGAEPLFDEPERYEQMLGRGLVLSGERRDYFARGRLDELERRLPAGRRPASVLDFGCGTGETAALLAERYAGARVVGVDASAAALDSARRRLAGGRVEFVAPGAPAAAGPFDLVYVNGVFHHVPVPERVATAAELRHRLAADGLLALFENNPWNPGARWVMRRIPFDRDAVMLSPREAAACLSAAGLEPLGRASTLFYFPRWLRPLRFLERRLAGWPFGAQYLVLARRGRSDRGAAPR